MVRHEYSYTLTNCFVEEWEPYCVSIVAKEGETPIKIYPEFFIF